ncbi:MAG TPA: DUF5916 domain-containing protein [Longimicrobium sp.]|jgi:hypothetical protein
MYRRLLPLALLIAGAAAASPAAAQVQNQSQTAAAPAQASRTSSGEPARVLRAAPGAEIKVDGRLDEAAWATAPAATDFVQQSPNAGQPATERTEARVLFTADAIYVGMRMYDSRPDSILGQLTRRDQGSTSDGARVFIDSYNDKRTAFVFGLNPKGVKDDFLRFDDGSGIDFGWDAVWDGAAQTDSAGWVAEFRIPLSQLRFNASTVNGGGRWGVNFRRYIARRAETAFWSPVPPNASGFVSLFGELEGLTGLRQSGRLEILPYTSARVSHPLPAPGNPFVESNDFVGSAGADLKAGLPGGLTLSATINPDFGQVEADPAVVNLSAFESFFEERRPFFVEGSDIFQFGQLNSFNTYGFTQFFYSRRVGRQPQGGVGVDGVLFADAPDATTILGAAKVSGKAGPWSIGVMDALTQREEARYLAEGDLRGEFPVEPLTNYVVGRVRRDFGRGATVVGALFTGVNRDMAGGEFDPFLRSSAYALGVDGQHAWHNREWALSGYYARSLVNGSAAAITRAQNSSARYFARPDADHVELDPARTSLGGHVAGAALSHTGSWDGSVAWQEVGPGFETNDIGFMTRADYRALSTFAGRRMNRPGRLFRSYSFYGYTNHTWNFDGDPIYASYNAGANATLKSLWGFGLGGGYSPEYVNDRLTRGGPLGMVPSQWRINANAFTDSRKPVSLSLNLGYREDTSGEFDRSVFLGVSYRPSSSVQVSLEPSFVRQRDTDQWIATTDDPAATATFGRRYTFASVDNTEFAVGTRVDWTFSPTLSLQMFAQPFVSDNDFFGYKTLRRARSFEFDPAAVAQEDDFKFLSLRGSAVLRWEYRPGSTLFFVWQQDRSGVDDEVGFSFRDDLDGVFGQRASNVFLIKATYWLNR